MNSSLLLSRKIIVALLFTLVGLCACQKQSSTDKLREKKNSDVIQVNTSSNDSSLSKNDAKSNEFELNPVHGLWSQRPFTARSAIARISPKWVTISLHDRQARCSNSELNANELALQLIVPTGPNNDFFAGRDIPVELRIHGGGGVSHIPAGYVLVNLNPFDATRDKSLQGTIRFRFPTAHDAQAPVYSSEGSFEAFICHNQPTLASAKNPEFFSEDLHGIVATRQVRMSSVHVYTRDNGSGQSILLFKAYENKVPCHTTRSATPYLFGIEIGPDASGNYTTAKPLPAPWQMQMRQRQFSERSVQSEVGTSWIQLDSVQLHAPMNTESAVTGRLVADNSNDEADWQFFISGQFKATMCGPERPAW